MIIYKCDRCKKEIPFGEHENNNLAIHFDFVSKIYPTYQKNLCESCIEKVMNFLESEVEE